MGLVRYYLGRTARNRAAVLGLAFILAMAMVAVLAPPFAQDPNAVDFGAKNLPPLGFTSSQVVYEAGAGLQSVELQGRWVHPLGTDDKGRDMLAMLLSGSRVSLLVGLVATGIAILLGTLIGVTSAYFGGRVDNALMRFTDVVMTFPLFLLLVFIVFLYGSNLAFITLIIGLTGWTATARLVRSEALSLRTREFVLAAKVLGVGDARIIARHLVPNVMGTIVVIATLSIPGAILAEAALSFIGLGDPQVASWGRILNSGQDSLEVAWWIAVEPGVLLFLTVLAFNFLGDGLRDAFDPRMEV